MLQKLTIGLLRYFSSRRKIGDLQPSWIKTIVVVELTRLGDVLAILPFLERLHHRFPNARIRVLVSQAYLPLLASFESGLQFIGIDGPGTLRGLVHALREVRDQPADLAVSMSPPRRNVLVALASDSRFTVGYLSHLDSLTPFLESTQVESFGFKLPVETVYGRENIYERPAKILMALGVVAEPAQWHARLKAGIYTSVKDQLTREGRFPHRQYILLHPFSGWDFRSWPLDNFFALAERIDSQLECDTVMSAGAGDLERLRRSVEGRPSVRTILSSDILEMAILTKDAQVVVGNDSGPLHLAALMNKRTVGLFGPSPPGLTGPCAGNGRYLYKRVECSPCDQRICVRPDRSCMTLLGVEEVFDAVARLVRSRTIDESLRANA